MISSGSGTASLVFKNDTSELGRLAEALDEFADRHELPDDARFQLQLCLEELVLNVMNYGFEDDEEHDIRVDLEYENDTRNVTVRIVDEGKEFDPLHDAPEPDLDGPIEERSIGGLGIHFVRHFVDDARYHRADGRNHLVLIKNVGT